MRAVTLRQPWASLVAAGVKRIETRSWRTAYRGRVAIHASKRAVPDVWRVLDLNAALRDVFDWRPNPGYPPPDALEVQSLPRGAVVATAELVGCVPVVDDVAMVDAPYLRVFAGGRLAGLRMTGVHAGDVTRDVSDQLPFGVFEPGRWAWLLDDIKPVGERCPWCWGARFACPEHGRSAECRHSTAPTCHVCAGRGGCDPVPARGRQGLWELEL